jgi:flagellar motor switch/type III secretory pathway protein FliN
METVHPELEPQTTGGTAFAPELPRIANLSVQASVCLGRGRMTLNELCRLTPGAILPLPIPCGTPTRLAVNDLELATGEVVRNGTRLGIRVQRLAAATDRR